MTVPVKEGGKGRPTPKRRTAEQANRRPLVGGAVAKPNATKDEKKAARALMREQRAQQRAAMMAGDERALPPRDRGPAKRWVRDFVDARRNLGEYFIYIAIFAVVLSVVNLAITTLVSMALLYGTVIVVAIDAFLLRRRVQRMAEEKFGEKAAQGAGTYALMRSLQLRRGRMPRPQVARGEFPV